MAEAKPPETEAAAEPAKKGGMARLLPLVGGIVGGLALGATLGFTLLGPKLSHKAAPTPAATAGGAEAAKGGAKDGQEVKKGEAAPSIYQLDNLVMNPAASGGAHFLLMSVALQLKDAGSLETLKGRDAELRDAILRLFSRKTIDQISDISARDEFSTELMVVLNKMFGDGTVTKIYFPQFVIQ
ncbi:MAG: flagellar basal body-associated FliL family protein [Gemmatimonadaceae bacterium]